ncbi:MAG: glycosyl hydrolase family 5 [Alteromonadaceae bacterium]|nr:MAG: glycosyl hydrolase family 5 [Alteromonadaceae bacterium]
MAPTSFGGVCKSSSGGGDDSGAAYACGIDPTTIPSDDDWLTTNGNQIVDSDGNSVWLAGANWFGMNATERVFHGLWAANMEKLLRETAERGINLIRVPISTQLLKEWANGEFPAVTVNSSTNPNLDGLNSIEVFDYFLAQAKSCGLKVMVDVHSAEADNSGHIAPLWYKGSVTTEDWVNTLGWVADHYKNDDTIVAYDLENEPHGIPKGTAESSQLAGESDFDYCNRLEETTDQSFSKWDDSTDINNWKYAAELGAKAVLDANPNVLIMIEGIEAYATQGKWVNPRKLNNTPEACYAFNWWGGNLRGVADMEVEAPTGLQDQIVYSPHDYGPLVFMQPWFRTAFDRDTLRSDVWEPNWLFIHNEGISPLFIGEWGGFMDGGDNQKWMEALRDEIAEERLHHTFWVINPNSGDTGGLLKADWETWDEEKYELLRGALWEENGKFVGLDKQVPLAGGSETGLSRSEHFGQ